MLNATSALAQIAEARGYTEADVEATMAYTSRRDRRTHPLGSFDRAGRFTLSERRDCCAQVRDPSRAYPLSEMDHGRSARHVAAVCGASAIAVNRLAKVYDELRQVDRLSAHQLIAATKHLKKA